MKPLLTIFAGWMLSVMLCSCPYCSAHGLDEDPTIYVEDALLGNWTTSVKKINSTNEIPVMVSFSKRTPVEYNITFTGYVDALRSFNVVDQDSVKGTAYMSTVDGRQFLNINVKARTYIAELRLQNDRLSIMPLAECFTGKMIFSSEALRNSVSFHYKSRVHPVFDDDFCLKDLVKTN